MKNIGSTVLISGGHGGRSIAPSLLKVSSELDCILGIYDSGGSTGIVRTDRKGVAHGAYGDFIEVMGAVMPRENKYQQARFELFPARMDQMPGSGHNRLKPRNWDLAWYVEKYKKEGYGEDVILRSLQELALTAEIPSNCRFLPLSTAPADICASPRSPRLRLGQHNNVMQSLYKRQHQMNNRPHGADPIIDVMLSPTVHIHPRAREAILKADKIFISAGSWWVTSAYSDVRGYPEAIRESKAMKILIVNLIAKHNDTQWDNASGFVDSLCTRLGLRSIDVAICNEPSSLPDLVREAYAREFAMPVKVSKRIPRVKKVIIEKVARWDEHGRAFHGPQMEEIFSKL